MSASKAKSQASAIPVAIREFILSTIKDKALGYREKIVVMYLLASADDPSGVIEASIGQISEGCNLAEDTIRAALYTLRSEGILLVVGNKKSGTRGRPSTRRYVFLDLVRAEFEEVIKAVRKHEKPKPIPATTSHNKAGHNDKVSGFLKSVGFRDGVMKP